MAMITGPARIQEVTGELNYLAPESTVLRRFTAPGASGFEFHHNPRHQWWYFPDMTRDEILLFKLNDSDHARAWRVPHSAFHDGTARATEPRHSIEFRTIAYFE